MKLTKKLEAEILKAYNVVWDAYLRGDMRTFASILDENCYIIGSAAGEVFKNKKAAVKYYRSTAEQITGKAQFRNRKIGVMAADKGLMVNEESDFYLLIDDQWTFYGPARISSLFHKKNNKWKVIHQHGSFPDSKTEEGEQVNTDKIKAENIQLRSAVKRRTEELESKNRELEIEAALEKVRSRTMAMHKSDELAEVATVLFEQMSLLENTPDRFNIRIANESEGVFEFWATDQEGHLVNKFFRAAFDKSPVVLQMYTSWKAKEKILIQDLHGDQLSEWVHYIKDELGVPFDLKHLKEHRFLSSVFFSNGMIGITTNDPPNPDTLQLIDRFAKVFDQTYTRFLDLQKAEAQVREAQIETGLERVRSKTMAMHKSEEVTGIAVSLNEELLKLGFEGGSTIIIIDKETGDTEQWTGFSEDKTLNSCYVPYFKHPCQDAQLDAWKSGKKFLVYNLTGKEKKTFDEHYFATGYKDFPESDKKWMRQMGSVTFSYAFMKYGAIHWGPGHLTEEQLRILQRFSKVFEQSYTRFLDLQKAEAQAREAKIEAALERVRSQSMAMHKSDDLHEVIKVVIEQLSVLGVKFNVANFAKIDPDGSWDLWLTTPEQAYPALIHVPYLDHPIFNDITEQVAKNNDFYTAVYTREEANIFFHHFFENTIAKNTPEERKQYVYNSRGFTRSLFLTKNIWFSVSIYDTTPFTDEENAIFKRFANVFEQAYTRFLDLQKAEAQAREARIEAALEKVRSRTMAMHKSDELNETNTVVIQQIRSLEIRLYAFGIHVCHADEPISEAWMGDPVGGYMPKVIYDHSQDPISIRMYAGWKEEKTLTVEKLEGDALKEHFGYMITLVPDRSIFDNLVSPESLVFHFAYFTHGFLVFLTQEHCPEEHSIFKRLAKVFEQTYTRFLDLQKAEAQVREAKIEAALERTRTQSMLMQHSDEIMNVSNVFHEQLLLLDIPTEFSYVWLPDETKQEHQFWATWAEEEKGITICKNKAITYPLDKTEPYTAACFTAWQSDEPVFIAHIAPADVKNYFSTWEELLRDAKRMRPEFFTEGLYYAEAYMKYGCFGFNIRRVLSEDERAILRRFTVEFERTYTRFLDLQKAEAQARESQIEAALERVRSRTMGMQKSEELKEVIQVVYEQFVHLDIKVEHSGFVMDYKERDDYHIWVADPLGVPSQVTVPYFDSVYYNRFNEAKEKGEDFFATNLSFEEKNRFYQKLFEYVPGLSEEAKAFYFSCPGLAASTVLLESVCLYIENFSGIAYTGEENNTLMRFAKVFQQTYTRFLDLQKAEAQAREAKIEAALERVRSRSMAMQKSDELPEVVAVLYKQFEELEFGLYQVLVSIYDKKNNVIEWWSRGFGNIELPQRNIIPIIDHPFSNDLFEKWENGVEYYPHVLEGEMKKSWDEYLFTGTDLKNFPQEVKDTMKAIDKVYLSDVFMKHGSLQAAGAIPLPDDKVAILERFVKVLDLAYTRMTDLQTAEMQTREAQIELGLERVRARAMAMQNSDELKELIGTVFTELTKLDLVLTRCLIVIFDPKTNGSTWWMANSEAPSDPIGLYIKYHEHPSYLSYVKAWHERNLKWQYVLEGKNKKEWDDFLFVETELSHLPDFVIAGMKAPDRVYLNASFNSFGNLTLASLEPLSKEHFDILLRFAKVFDLTYTRFNDLKQAEAQAREATIEAALERVRGKAMAMHSSKDLATTIGVFYHELEGLDLTPRRCGVGLIDKEKQTAEISTMNASADGQSIELVGVLDMRRHPVLTSVYNNWLTKTEYHPVLRGNEIKEYYQLVRPQIDFPDYPNDTVQYGYFFYFDEGGVYAWTEKELNEEELKIYRRFTSVLSLTYKRYKDLKDAEARTQAAIKDAALDRIRADIASMRTINDLDRITPLIWNELTVLGIPFIRCGVFIMDEEQELIHTFLSTPDGKAIAAFHLPYDTPGNISKVIDGWRHKKIYLDHWGKEEFVQFADILTKQGALNSREQYLKTIPYGGFYLHFLPFLQGMLYVGNATQLGDEEIELIQHVADAFSTAYARYEDFNKLEAAKQTVEKTLTDLKQTQQQLVQSEKMASLGELTAGIAHEIQNPLNFVNNFSEVSKELLDEMKTELETGNTEDAKDIADDVIQNLEKINHHGKRADAIVKSMLQHSRSSSGKKEPTDINALADEYLRLAYHGLRAKDKSFNAKFETGFDNNIGKVNIISQDIGRVLVNLINNAFYAVSERKKQESNGYEPTVEVLTKKTDDKIEIKVKDNGNGIPQKVLDKIFQPFFTTKPTGQGTGLGLSLAYDIVTKGHGGEIKVETKENEGTEFIIQLPV